VDNPDLVVVGGGLAGCEAAWQAAERGLRVRLCEMRPARMTAAHTSDRLAELVCSNSLGSVHTNRAGGMLKTELERMGSLLLAVAIQNAVPAGGALAVDRAAFAQFVTERLQSHPRVEVVREEVTQIPEGLAILASGPLTSARLSAAIADFTGHDHLYFFDALAPIVSADSIDMSIAFRQSRGGEGADYINCAMDAGEYHAFVAAMRSAERASLREFEQDIERGERALSGAFFEGCLPIETIAERGEQSLAFGPLRPVGLHDPRTGMRPHAVVQLRQEDRHASLYNLVGFQTNLRVEDQKRVFRLIPGLAHAEFVRFGQMHRNTFVNAPRVLLPTLQTRLRADLLMAGQITGVEGYLGNVATGLLAGWNAARLARGMAPLTLPPTTMLGALCAYVSSANPKHFQPMKSIFGILPPLEARPRARLDRGQVYADRGRLALEGFLAACATV
jgi:methylenetetrahydrofolate--tRNA-(uracil-5-)-methyltransferase